MCLALIKVKHILRLLVYSNKLVVLYGQCLGRLSIDMFCTQIYR